MENASKALIMAAGILLALMIIVLFVYMWNSISGYQNAVIEAELIEQLVYENNQFLTYNRDDVRGNEVVSLANKVIDYNVQIEGSGTTKMELSIVIGNESQREKFAYDEIQILNDDIYDEESIQDLLGSSKDEYSPIGIENTYGITICAKLSSNVYNIVDSEYEDALSKINQILLSPVSTQAEVKEIQEKTLIYYEYTQLKRAYFDCTNFEYDELGRIIKIEFEFNGTFN